MEHKISEAEAEALLRNKSKRSKLEKILPGPSEPKFAVFAVVGAVALDQYSLRGFVFPDLTGALFVGTFAGLIATMVQLWGVRWRLDPLIELMKTQKSANRAHIFFHVNVCGSP